MTMMIIVKRPTALNHRVIQTAYVNGMMMNVKIGTTMMTMTTMIIAKFTMMTLKAVLMTLDASLNKTTVNTSVMRTKITTTAIMAMVIQETEALPVKIQTMMDKMMMSIRMMTMMELATNKTHSLTIQTSMRIPMVTV